MSNQSSWDLISPSYQQRLGWPATEIVWGIRCASEDELQILGPLNGQRCLVLGCGGGQDCLALHQRGAASVTGVDFSAAQLEHARLLLEQYPDTRLIHHSVEDLPMIESASIDTVVSIHALTYVKDIGATFDEACRVLAPGGRFAFSVHHPIDAATADEPPYGFNRSCFQTEVDWSWGSLGGEKAAFTSYYRSVSDWFTIASGHGFRVERMLEPPPVDRPMWENSGWAQGSYYEKLATVPGTLIVVARKA